MVRDRKRRPTFQFSLPRHAPAARDLRLPVGPAAQFPGWASGSWSYIDRTGAWTEIPMLPTAGDVADEPTLDDQQFAAMVRDSEVDETIVLLRDRGPLPGQLLSDIYANVQAALRVAVLAKLAQNLHLDWCIHCLHNAVPSGEKDGINSALAWRETRFSNIRSDDENNEPF
jgi:hypothetical protein